MTTTTARMRTDRPTGRGCGTVAVSAALRSRTAPWLRAMPAIPPGIRSRLGTRPLVRAALVRAAVVP
eukprot:4434557-Prymnesium_polylepis.1